ncbi:hypothetical protein F4703DRAFT_1918534 [Phycomyces blakesleeanus]
MIELGDMGILACCTTHIPTGGIQHYRVLVQIGEVHPNSALSSSWIPDAQISASFVYGAGGFHTTAPSPNIFAEAYPNHPPPLTYSASCFLCGLMHHSTTTRDHNSIDQTLSLSIYPPLSHQHQHQQQKQQKQKQKQKQQQQQTEPKLELEPEPALGLELELTMFSPLVESIDHSESLSRPLVNRLDSITLYASSRPTRYMAVLCGLQNWIREWKDWVCQKGARGLSKNIRSL